MNDMQLAALVHDVANAMCTRGESWTLVPDAKRGFGVDMRSRDGEIVNFQDSMTGGYPRPRLWIEFIDPLTVRPVTKPISVANSRPPLAIAREIASRLLPGAREELASRRAKEAQAKAAFEARASAVNAAEALFGKPTDFGEYRPAQPGEHTSSKTEARLALRGRHTRQMGRYEHTDTEFARVEVTDFAAGLMNVELRDIPAPVVMRMLAVLAEHNAAQPEASA
jgi:hypothetical protein